MHLPRLGHGVELRVVPDLKLFSQKVKIKFHRDSKKFISRSLTNKLKISERTLSCIKPELSKKNLSFSVIQTSTLLINSLITQLFTLSLLLTIDRIKMLS